MTPDERLAFYEAGADATPCDDLVMPSAGQAWHALLTMPPDRRLAKLGHMLSNADVSYACFAEDHRRQIEMWKDRYERLCRVTGTRT